MGKRRVEMVSEKGDDFLEGTNEEGQTFRYWSNTTHTLDGKRIDPVRRLWGLLDQLLESEAITQLEYENVGNQLPPIQNGVVLRGAGVLSPGRKKEPSFD